MPMFDTDAYLQELTDAMKREFGERLLYVGLQGSYLRGEATENSDLDVMVLIDRLSVQDLSVYRAIIAGMENYEKSCGFICGRDEFLKWNPLELCHVQHSTRDYYGKLADLIPGYEKQDVFNYIKISLGNLYHEICHRYVHADRDRNVLELPMTCKGVFFILQNLYFLRTGVFYQTRKEMMRMLEDEDREIMDLSLAISASQAYNFEQAFEKLFLWCQRKLVQLDHA